MSKLTREFNYPAFNAETFLSKFGYHRHPEWYTNDGSKFHTPYMFNLIWRTAITNGNRWVLEMNGRLPEPVGDYKGLSRIIYHKHSNSYMLQTGTDTSGMEYIFQNGQPLIDVKIHVVKVIFEMGKENG
jgi:hypothetical protein